MDLWDWYIRGKYKHILVSTVKKEGEKVFRYSWVMVVIIWFYRVVSGPRGEWKLWVISQGWGERLLVIWNLVGDWWISMAKVIEYVKRNEKKEVLWVNNLCCPTKDVVCNITFFQRIRKKNRKERRKIIMFKYSVIYLEENLRLKRGGIFVNSEQRSKKVLKMARKAWWELTKNYEIRYDEELFGEEVYNAFGAKYYYISWRYLKMLFFVSWLREDKEEIKGIWRKKDYDLVYDRCWAVFPEYKEWTKYMMMDEVSGIKKRVESEKCKLSVDKCIKEIRWEGMGVIQRLGKKKKVAREVKVKLGNVVLLRGKRVVEDKKVFYGYLDDLYKRMGGVLVEPFLLYGENYYFFSRLRMRYIWCHFWENIEKMIWRYRWLVRGEYGRMREIEGGYKKMWKIIKRGSVEEKSVEEVKREVAMMVKKMVREIKKKESVKGKEVEEIKEKIELVIKKLKSEEIKGIIMRKLEKKSIGELKVILNRVMVMSHNEMVRNEIEEIMEKSLKIIKIRGHMLGKKKRVIQKELEEFVEERLQKIRMLMKEYNDKDGFK